MKNSLLLATATTLVALSLGAAESNCKDDVVNAAKALREKDNYSWRTTVVVPEDARFKPGPTEGKTEKDGYTLLAITFGENETKAVLKGEKGAATDREGAWQSLSDL